MEFGQIRENSGNLGETQGNSVEFSKALNMNSCEISGQRRVSGKCGVWGRFWGDLGPQKGFCANYPETGPFGTLGHPGTGSPETFFRTLFRPKVCDPEVLLLGRTLKST